MEGKFRPQPTQEKRLSLKGLMRSSTPDPARTQPDEQILTSSLLPPRTSSATEATYVIPAKTLKDASIGESLSSIFDQVYTAVQLRAQSGRYADTLQAPKPMKKHLQTIRTLQCSVDDEYEASSPQRVSPPVLPRRSASKAISEDMPLSFSNKQKYTVKGKTREFHVERRRHEEAVVPSAKRTSVVDNAPSVSIELPLRRSSIHNPMVTKGSSPTRLMPRESFAARENSNAQSPVQGAATTKVSCTKEFPSLYTLGYRHLIPPTRFVSQLSNDFYTPKPPSLKLCQEAQVLLKRDATSSMPASPEDNEPDSVNCSQTSSHQDYALIFTEQEQTMLGELLHNLNSSLCVPS
jgi:hypothetical protein